VGDGDGCDSDEFCMNISAQYTVILFEVCIL
jgi:hypothetical protein